MNEQFAREFGGLLWHLGNQKDGTVAYRVYRTLASDNTIVISTVVHVSDKLSEAQQVDTAMRMFEQISRRTFPMPTVHEDVEYLYHNR